MMCWEKYSFDYHLDSLQNASVCKRWLRLISSPSFPTKFVSRQHSLSPRQLMLGFFPSDLDFNGLFLLLTFFPKLMISKKKNLYKKNLSL